MSTFSRRDWLKTGAAGLGALALSPLQKAAAVPATWDAGAARRASASPDTTDLSTKWEGDRAARIYTPGGSSLTGRQAADGAWVYHLTAQEVEHEFAPGLTASCWGYNGSVHGPTIEAVEGDRLRFYVTNRLGAPTTVHWHGLFLPSGMDGVGGLSQPSIQPGETFRYEFDVRQNGTFMYHSHHDEMAQIALGLTGLFIVHPRRDPDPPDRDVAIMLHEWLIHPGTSRPDPNAMSDFNLLTMNGKAFPATPSVVIGLNDRVRFRFGNLSPMDHHPIHLHGYAWKIVATDGGPIPTAGQWPETTVLVPTGSTRTTEFVADAPGDWAMHCHMTHHVMNQMGHDVPNVTGVPSEALNRTVQPLLPGYMAMGEYGMDDMGKHVEMGHMAVPENSIPMVGGDGPFGYITMGGMYTNLKVRAGLTDYDRDPGWYDHPPGTVARAASPDELARDGVSV